jgi:protein arginine N-methyltransferase 1
VKEGETITGTFSLGPNKQNERDLEIEISYKFHGSNSESEAVLDYVMR